MKIDSCESLENYWNCAVRNFNVFHKKKKTYTYNYTLMELPCPSTCSHRTQFPFTSVVFKSDSCFAKFVRVNLLFLYIPDLSVIRIKLSWKKIPFNRRSSTKKNKKKLNKAKKSTLVTNESWFFVEFSTLIPNLIWEYFKKLSFYGNLVDNKTIAETFNNHVMKPKTLQKPYKLQ